MINDSLYDQRHVFDSYQELVIDGYTDFIFRSIGGEIYNPSTINDAFNKVVLQYNQEETSLAEEQQREPVLLPHITCHILRHTFATRLVEYDCNIKTAQSVLGHRDVQTTLSIYVDSTPEKRQESFKELDGKFKIK